MTRSGIGRLTARKEVLYIPLGTGTALKYGVMGKAALLDIARRAGLPVPPGIILIDEAWQRAHAEGFVRVTDDGRVIAPDPSRLYYALNLPNFNWELEGPFAVRSAFSAEDGSSESMAGFFTSRLWVDGRDSEQFIAALCAVWESAARVPGEYRRDVLIMRMIDAQHSGVAFTEGEFEDDLVNYVEGTAEKLVAGEVPGESLVMPKLRTGERSTAGLPDWAGRLQTLLRAVRKQFSHRRTGRDWDVEWADDGKTCWLLQVRPVTRPTRRNETFTIANHKEILPELPSIFMTSLIESCAEGLFAYYRGFDRTLPARRPFIEIFNGRPYINLSLLVEMMRSFGLPSRLVTDSIGGEVEHSYPTNLRRMARKALPLLRFGMAHLLSVGAARRAWREILARTEQLGTTFGANVETLRWVYTTLVTGMFSLTAAISLPMLLMRRLGTLEEHSARSRSIATELYTDLEPLQTLVADMPHLRGPLERGELPDDSQFRTLWERYFAKHGQRGIYESDIARPRFREAPGVLLAMIAHGPPEKRPIPRRTLRGLLTAPLGWQSNRVVRARELLRYHAMTGFERLRSAFLALADQAVAKGQLPSRSWVWNLSVDELRQLDDGWVPDAAFFAAREAEIERLRAMPVPDLLHRFDDLSLAAGDDTENGAHLRGVSLTTGEVKGRAWVLNEPDVKPPAELTDCPIILVARSVDAGWIPTLTYAAGAVVETGGDLSHGSIILREIGLPAITNVRAATRRLKTGDVIVLRAGSGVVERMNQG